jgi:dTDP-4-amino-4,6-dideoxygalactose transaminase
MHFEGFGPWPQYSDAEQRAVVQVLATGRVNYWTGELCRRFEAEFARFADCTHAAALANGTVALDVALRALGIGPGDEVIVTPRSFVASVSAVANAGATPIFADVDLDSGNISAATIAPCITAKTKAVVPVHLGGWPCDMPSIIDLTRSHGLAVIEDCAQAHGAAIDGRSVGSFGEVGAWSFCQDKIMTTGGEGGMVTTNDPELWRLMWEYKDHGKNLDKVRQPHTSAGFRWLHDSFGTNWRMIEMQAAIGLLQLEVMSRWRERRAELASRYAALMADFSGLVRVPSPPLRMSRMHITGSTRTYGQQACEKGGREIASSQKPTRRVCH